MDGNMIDPQTQESQLQPPVGAGDLNAIPAASIDPSEQPIGWKIQPPQRRKSLIKEPEKVLADIIAKYNADLDDRSDWAERRIQRTAKYRGWRETKTFPWENSSNAHLPIIMTDVQRTEDTLHNAVLSVRPVMNAKAANADIAEKEKTIDNLLDHQVFVENQGEVRIGNLISSFTQDGQFIAYVPYIKEKQKTTKVHMIDFPPVKISWDGWIMQHLQEYYPLATILPGTKAPWNWVLRETHPLTGDVDTYKIDVYQDEDEAQVQLICHNEDTIFDGPSLIPKELEDIVVPGRAENLQPQCMSNPTGASHVFMVEYPSKDEILKLIEAGFYDEVTDEQIAAIKATNSTAPQEAEDPNAQKNLQDDLTGIETGTNANPQEDPFTRIMFFGRADLDNDGFEEEVVYWLLKTPQILLRARYLSEVYPAIPMRRPFAMAKYIPVNGQFYAIGLIELMESGYDIIKKTFDQMVDSGDLTNTPWGFYRPMSGIRPEIMRMGPGDLYPTNSPKDDVYYPQLPQGMASFGHNLITLVSQILDQTTLVGQLQLGGVPQGKSAALRTTSNMQALLQQGDARPERVLRRFFNGLAEVWQQFHELNQIFLPKAKQFRISTGVTDAKNPYITVPDRNAISGRFMFEFGASILNTNKSLATASLQDMLSVLINPLLLQARIVTPENIYNLIRDFIKAKGQDPVKYITSPTNDPFASGPHISVEDALMSILNGYYPHGQPMEPLDQHLQKLQEFVSNPENLKFFTPSQQHMLGQYAAVRVHEMQQQIEQQQMMMQAAQMQQNMGGKAQGSQGGQGGPQGRQAPPSTGPAGNAKVQGKELLNESLPGAGGGQNG
jgi:hypothetical protein